MTSTNEEKAVIYVKCKNDFLFYTRYIFKETTHRKFIVAEHHELIAGALQRVANGEITKLIINIAPRYSKTELAVKMFVSWCLAFNSSAKFIHLSYSDTLALDNSEEIKDIIQSDEYKHIFGKIEIKKDSNSKKKWYTTTKGGVYATSAGGQVTGFGAGYVDEEEDGPEMDSIDSSNGFGGAIIIDDPNKPEDAGSMVALERITKRFESTIRNRVNSRNTPIIIIQQRIDPKDLCGYLIESEPNDWEVLSIPCLKEDGTAIWPHKHTVEELKKIRASDVIVFDNQYQQDPKPREGLMYAPFNTYRDLPKMRKIKAYCDTADTGKDQLCSIVYGEPEDTDDKKKYVIDVILTVLAMEKTEVMVSEQYDKCGVRHADIESNNGGRGFARIVDKKTDNSVYVEWFYQGNNKNSRIYANSGSVNTTMVMPEDWDKKWPDFYKQVTAYKKMGGNKFDDAEDCLTGCYEKSISTGTVTMGAQIGNVSGFMS